MTATLPARRPATNGKPGGPRHRIEVDRHALVGMCMDFEALTSEAITAAGYALQSVCRLPPDPLAFEARDALKALYPRLTRLLNEARLAAGRFDTTPARRA